ncbi:MAG: hypothetical protein R3C14_09155 [Caldilineaceae bacterium]
MTTQTIERITQARPTNGHAQAVPENGLAYTAARKRGSAYPG